MSEPSQSLACNLGITGKLIRQALVTQNAPPDFRETLRRQLFDPQRIAPARGLPAQSLAHVRDRKQ